MIRLMSIFFLGLLLVSGCEDPRRATHRQAVAMTGGDPDKGRSAIQMHGCASCHTIPGVPGADSLVGPPLTSISQRTYLAGILPNTPKNMIRWIKDPPAVDAKTAMPNVHLNESEARDIASYLYTLR
jgi:cytochrome c